MAVRNKSFTNFLFSTGGVAAMFLLLAGIYVLTTMASARVDMTEEKVYTLSEGTKAILEKLDTPVTIRFYVTQSKEMPVHLKTYAQRVENLLKEYNKYGGGNIRIKKYNPTPLSDAEDSARLDGVIGQPGPSGERIYLGLAVTMLDSKEALPFLDPGRERLLEYDISRAISNVMTPEKPVLGIMSGLPVFGQMNPMMMMQGGGRQDPWIFVQELQRDFDVREIQTTAESIDPEVDLLVVVHPKNLSDATLYALDQFVMRGGSLVAFVDPLSMVDAQSAPGNNPLQGAMNAGSSLEKLTTAWGLEYDPGKVVADLLYMTKITRQGQPQDAPAVLSLTGQAVNTNEVVTSQLGSLLLPFAGTFTGTPAEGLTQTVLLHSSEKSQLVEKFIAQFSGDQILRDFAASGKKYPLALRLTGTFKTAFPEGKPVSGTNTTADASAPAHQAESKGGSVVLVADTDMLFDHFAAQVQNFLGRRIIFPKNANLTFVQNVVEQMGGDENLIAIRSRATMNRPLTRVREMELAAQERFRSKIQELQQSQEEMQARLNELQQVKQAGQQFILSPEQQEEIENFREKQAQVSQELNQVEKELMREVKSLENRLKWLNIAGMPLLVTVAGLGLALVKRKKTAAK